MPKKGAAKAALFLLLFSGAFGLVSCDDGLVEVERLLRDAFPAEYFDCPLAAGFAKLFGQFRIVDEPVQVVGKSLLERFRVFGFKIRSRFRF